MKKHLSVADLIVIIITFLLFITALFTKGLTNDILLEAGVLLVSVKIILMNYKNNQSDKIILREIDDLKRKIDELKGKQDNL